MGPPGRGKMWSIPRTLIKFWVSGYLKIRWVLDGYLGRFGGRSGGASWEPKSLKLALRGRYVRKKVLLERFFGCLKKQVNLRYQKVTATRIGHPKLGPWGEGREGGSDEDCLTETSKPRQPLKGWWDFWKNLHCKMWYIIVSIPTYQKRLL